METSPSLAIAIPFWDEKKTSIESWLKTFEKRAIIHNLQDDARKIIWCGAFIGTTGEAVLDSLEEGTSWEDAKDRLLQKLGGHRSADGAWNRLQALQRDGRSFQGLAVEAERLAAASGAVPPMIDRMAQAAFLKAVGPQMQYELRKMKPQSLEQLVKDACILEEIQQECRSHKAEEVPLLREQIRTMREEMTRMALPDPPPVVAKAQPAVPQRRRLLCCLCDEEGHFVRDCPIKQEAKRLYKRAQQKPADGGPPQPQTRLN